MQKKSQWDAKYIWREPTLEETGNKVSDVHARVYARNTSAWIHLNSIGTVVLEKLTFSNKPFHEGFQPDYCFHNIDTILILQCSIVVRRLSRFNHDEDCQLTTAICHSSIASFSRFSRHICSWSLALDTVCEAEEIDALLWQLEHSQAEEWMVWQHFADEVASGSNSWSWVTS